MTCQAPMVTPTWGLINGAWTDVGIKPEAIVGVLIDDFLELYRGASAWLALHGLLTGVSAGHGSLDTRP